MLQRRVGTVDSVFFLASTAGKFAEIGIEDSETAVIVEAENGEVPQNVIRRVPPPSNLRREHSNSTTVVCKGWLPCPVGKQT